MFRQMILLAGISAVSLMAEVKDPLFIHNKPQIEIKADYKAEPTLPTFLEKAVTIIMTPIAVGAMAYEGAGAAVGATVTGAAGVVKDAVLTNDNNETKEKEQ